MWYSATPLVATAILVLTALRCECEAAEEVCMAPLTDAAGMNGRVIHIEFIDNTYMLKYNTLAVYECNSGFEFPDGTLLQTSKCQLNLTWSSVDGCICKFNATQNKRIKFKMWLVSCPAFNVENGIKNSLSLTYGSDVTVTCNSGYVTGDGMPSATVMCNSSKQWSYIPRCDRKRIVMEIFNQLPDRMRDNPSALVTDVAARSRIECASLCLKTAECIHANFRDDNGADENFGVCRMFKTHTDGYDVTASDDWRYLYIHN